MKSNDDDKSNGRSNQRDGNRGARNDRSSDERATNQRAMDEMSNTWKQQVEGFVRAVQAFADGSMRFREAQMRALSGARESFEDARRLIERTLQSQDLWRTQNEWLADGFERSLRYFNEVTQAAAETQSRVARQMFEPVAFAPQTTVLPEASKTAVGMMDDAYRRWRDTALQFYGPDQPFVRKLAEQSQAARRAAQDAMARGAEQFEDFADEEGARGEDADRENGNRGNRGQRGARAQQGESGGQRGRGRRASAGENGKRAQGQGSRRRAKQAA